jgi:hypothetical protein
MLLVHPLKWLAEKSGAAIGGELAKQAWHLLLTIIG